jgi:hypothetical protein
VIASFRAPELTPLTADRLKLAAHIEPREVPVYALVMARPNHAGLTPVSLDCDAVRVARDTAMKAGQGPPAPGANGAPLCGYRPPRGPMTRPIPSRRSRSNSA